MSFGPTQLSRPADFVPGISSFEVDGGHFALEVRPSPATVPAEAVAYVQLALPTLRASKVLAFGGEVVDAYGVWNVLAPGGVPVRLLVGDERRDRVMYVAYRVPDAKKAAAFYGAYGFARAPYPRARPPTADESPFDPNPPKNAVYLESCADAVGVLLIPEKKKRKAADAPAAGADAVGALRLRSADRAGVARDGAGLVVDLAGDI